MSVVITRSDLRAYSEVDYIIKHMDEKYANKVPDKLRGFFDAMKDPTYEVYVDPYKPLQKQGLQKYALEIIALLHLKYWCENEERRQQLYDLMVRNQEKLEEQMREKFAVDKLFDNNKATVVTNESDLEEKEDFSKPKQVQYYSQLAEENPDEIQDYTDVQYEEKPPAPEKNMHEMAPVDASFKGFIDQWVEKIKSFFAKFKKDSTPKPEDKK